MGYSKLDGNGAYTSGPLDACGRQQLEHGRRSLALHVRVYR
jgi:hypothetical protein